MHDVNEDVVIGMKQLGEVKEHLLQDLAGAPLHINQLNKKVVDYIEY